MIIDILILICGLALVILGAEWLVDGSSSIARRAGLSEFLIGMTIVGIGTSMPELVVSLTGALRGSADIAIGNVVGSNIFNVFLILGLTALIRPVAITRENKSRDIPIMILTTVLLVCFGMQKTLFGLGSSDTITAVEIGYMTISFMSGKAEVEGSPEEESKGPKKLWVAVIMVLAGLAGLIFGGDLFVDSACKIAEKAGLSEKFIAITILATGTSLPELVTCIVAASKGKGALALGNIIGSNVSNILLILGCSALACPLSFANVHPVDLIMVLLSAFVLLASAWTGRNNKVGRGDGASFLVLFAAYMVFLIMNI